ncbi:hypothetical protein COD91_16295 [Bacillus cereus]|nr:hypothetical protein COD91_16295 [Bacillus cereus]
MKILRLQRFSATNLISSVFKEQSVQVNDSKHVTDIHLPPKIGVSHLHIFEEGVFCRKTIKD